tara:strand:+ start:1252 stop:1404 length:153 start_codon:yes stop_codon:yes gene_type:complete
MSKDNKTPNEIINDFLDKQQKRCNKLRKRLNISEKKENKPTQKPQKTVNK